MDDKLLEVAMIKKWIVLVTVLLLMTAINISAAEQNVVMEIKGMTCPLCPIAVKKSLTKIEGVRDVQVSLEEEKARLTVDESVIDATLIEAVKKAGSYKSKVVERTAAK